MNYRIGIDVGGTNTDAVMLDNELRIVAAVKVPTEERSGSGVSSAIEQLLAAARVPSSEISAAMLGTTHCTNAIVQRKGLSRVGVLRLGSPATTAVPPFEGWPIALRTAVEGYVKLLSGGHEYTGAEINPLIESEVRDACAAMLGKVDAVAVVGVFSPVNDQHERRVAEIVVEELRLPVSRSAEIGAVGLLERENATILNAALVSTLGDMADGFQQSLNSHGISADIYFGQNDGTLMRLEYALQFPVLTIGCGPTNSIRGAAHLSGVENALVVDIGGTTTDIGVLVDGFPRQSAHAVEIGGIRTNFRMPDVLSVGLGGGSIVRVDDSGSIVIGPESVGYRITQEAQLFGGTTLTASDIAASEGRFTVAGRAAPDLPQDLLLGADARMQTMLEEAIDRMKPSAQPVPVVLVGGGSVIVPGELEGVSELILPKEASAANAVGAALGDIAGEASRVFSLQEVTRAAAIEETKSEAIERAIAAGANPATISVLSIEDIPVAYFDDAFTVKVRAAGRLTR